MLKARTYYKDLPWLRPLVPYGFAPTKVKILGREENMPLTSVPFHHTGRSPGTLRTLNTDKKRVSFLLPQPESSCPESKNFYRPWEPCDSENQSQHSQMPNPHLKPDPEAKENLALDLISALYKKEHSELFLWMSVVPNWQPWLTLLMSTAWESAAATVSAMSASEQKRHEGNACYTALEVTALDVDDSVQYVMGGFLPNSRESPTWERFWNKESTYRLATSKLKDSSTRRSFVSLA